MKENLQKPTKIFIAGYSVLSEAEKKEADKIIKKLKSDGHEITMGL